MKKMINKIKNSLWFFMDGSAMLVFLILMIFSPTPIIVIPFFIFTGLGFLNILVINEDGYRTHKFKGRLIEIDDLYQAEYSINSIFGFDKWVYLGSFDSKERGIKHLEQRKQQSMKHIVHEI